MIDNAFELGRGSSNRTTRALGSVRWPRERGLWSLANLEHEERVLEASEKEKMLSGELYRASDPELVRERQRCRSLLQAFNTFLGPLR